MNNAETTKNKPIN